MKLKSASTNLNCSFIKTYNITSPVRPNGQGYFPNSNCHWFFNVAQNCQPFFECSGFDVANSLDCSEDYVRGELLITLAEYYPNLKYPDLFVIIL